MPETSERPMTDHEAFVENTRRMQEIVRAMKEVPELPSESPKGDVNPLEKVEFPEAGGVLTYMGGYAHPYKGFPMFDFVDRIDVIKKIARGSLSSLYHSFRRRSKLQILCLIFVPWLFRDLLLAGLYTFYRQIERFKIKEIRHCDAMRELYKAFSFNQEELTSERDVRLMVRDVVCMVLEFDNAYRFRFQDIIVELDKEKLRANPSKELLRLADIMISRENTQEIKDTWRLFKFFLPWYLRFNKKVRLTLVEILTRVDLTKVALSIEDKTYCEKRKDYTFGYIQNVSHSILHQ